ncbi:hypothetical protein ACFT9I_14485 [Streptomyces sp. NPDC057137]|uniref:hypothetical protein n=1 Tax=Streptomyces sp. NPDC057137 TaxID=3346030 RepID=UPI0036455D5F
MTASDPNPGPEPGPLLSAHAALVLVTAAFIGTIVGTLTYFSTHDTPAALLAGLTASGAGTLALDRLIGH